MNAIGDRRGIRLDENARISCRDESGTHKLIGARKTGPTGSGGWPLFSILDEDEE